jgi:hypothetical protein
MLGPLWRVYSAIYLYNGQNRSWILIMTLPLPSAEPDSRSPAASGCADTVNADAMASVV